MVRTFSSPIIYTHIHTLSSLSVPIRNMELTKGRGLGYADWLAPYHFCRTPFRPLDRSIGLISSGPLLLDLEGLTPLLALSLSLSTSETGNSDFGPPSFPRPDLRLRDWPLTSSGFALINFRRRGGREILCPPPPPNMGLAREGASRNWEERPRKADGRQADLASINPLPRQRYISRSDSRSGSSHSHSGN